MVRVGVHCRIGRAGQGGAYVGRGRLCRVKGYVDGVPM